jgi:ABC-type uncharacterized transport system ATPase subunit
MFRRTVLFVRFPNCAMDVFLEKNYTNAVKHECVETDALVLVTLHYALVRANHSENRQ